MTEFKSMLTWHEDEHDIAKQGDGISRPMPGVPTERFTVSVVQPGTRPLRMSFFAESAELAFTYARARWPNAHVSLSDRPISLLGPLAP